MQHVELQHNLLQNIQMYSYDHQEANASMTVFWF